jgi:hypothetical protein
VRVKYPCFIYLGRPFAVVVNIETVLGDEDDHLDASQTYSSAVILDLDEFFPYSHHSPPFSVFTI